MGNSLSSQTHKSVKGIVGLRAEVPKEGVDVTGSAWVKYSQMGLGYVGYVTILECTQEYAQIICDFFKIAVHHISPTRYKKR